MKIALLPGDGIGPEVVAEAAKLLEWLRREGLPIETETALIGGAAYDAAGSPLPDVTLELASKTGVARGFAGESRMHVKPSGFDRNVRPADDAIAPQHR